MVCLQRHVHHSTVVRCVRILTHLLRTPALLAKFRDGSFNGAWLNETEVLLKNKGGTLLGFHVGSALGRMSNYEVKRESCAVGGFAQMQWFLPKHAEISELYLLLMALLLGQDVQQLPSKKQVRYVIIHQSLRHRTATFI